MPALDLGSGGFEPVGELVAHPLANGGRRIRAGGVLEWLELDCPVIVGRGAAVKGIDLAMYAAGDRSAIDTVSRQHLMLNLQDVGSANMRLSVLDLNSTNGTMVQRWTGGSFDVVQSVPGDRETHLGTRDRVILGESLLLRLSGKRYLAEPTSPPQVAGPDDEPSATTVTRVSAVSARADREPAEPTGQVS